MRACQNQPICRLILIISEEGLHDLIPWRLGSQGAGTFLEWRSRKCFESKWRECRSARSLSCPGQGNPSIGDGYLFGSARRHENARKPNAQAGAAAVPISPPIRPMAVPARSNRTK